MLRFLLFIPVYFVSSIGVSQKLRYQGSTTQEDLIRNFKIKTVAAYIYFFRNEGSLDSALSAITNYDSLGNITEYRTYRNGKMWAKTVYEFQSNRLVSKEEYVPEVKDTLSYQYAYDTAEHKTVERIRSKKYSHTTVKEYFYKGDNLMKVLVKYGKEKFKPETVFEYHSDGFIKKLVSYSEKIPETKLFIYDDDNRMVTVLVLDGKEKKGKENEELFYNKNGQLIKERTVLTANQFASVTPGPKYAIGSIVYEYDYNADGTLYEKRIIKDNKLISYIRYFYFK